MIITSLLWYEFDFIQHKRGHRSEASDHCYFLAQASKREDTVVWSVCKLGSSNFQFLILDFLLVLIVLSVLGAATFEWLFHWCLNFMQCWFESVSEKLNDLIFYLFGMEGKSLIAHKTKGWGIKTRKRTQTNTRFEKTQLGYTIYWMPAIEISSSRKALEKIKWNFSKINQSFWILRHCLNDF